MKRPNAHRGEKDLWDADILKLSPNVSKSETILSASITPDTSPRDILWINDKRGARHYFSSEVNSNKFDLLVLFVNKNSIMTSFQLPTHQRIGVDSWSMRHYLQTRIQIQNLTKKNKSYRSLPQKKSKSDGYSQTNNDAIVFTLPPVAWPKAKSLKIKFLKTKHTEA